MEIKGTAIRPTLEFVKERFPESYTAWINSLPVSSKKLLEGVISAALWYPINDAVIVPTRILGEMFYNDPKDAAMEVGRYSADKSLTGVYKVFIRVATPKFLISRTATIFSSYYNPANIKYEVLGENSAELIIYEFSEVEELMLHRIAGWIQRAFELTGRKSVKALVSKHYESDVLVYKVTASWH
jgi:hypothetical protein